MYEVAYAVLKNPYDAEDVVHDVVVKLIDKLDYFRKSYNTADFKSLILITTRNCAINKYNKNKKYREKVSSTTKINEDNEAVEIDVPDIDSDVQQIVISEESISEVHRLIESLPEKYKEVFVLSSIGYDNKQISDLLGISIDTVRQRICRGRAKLIEMAGDKLYGSRS